MSKVEDLEATAAGRAVLEFREAARDARSAIASTIVWLESLHPTRSRVERLNILREAHDRLARALRQP